MRRHIAIILTTVALTGIGAAAAQAASSGSYASISVTGATVTNGSYNFFYGAHDCVQGSCLYYTRITGTLSVTKGDAHLQAKSDGYGYVSIWDKSGTETVNFAKSLSPGDVRYADQFTLQLCHEKVLWDECKSRVVNR
ncbi:hypothetical protein CWIS_00120 [Cellulomonas sp. A375-1]|uniref:DM13 domain-containing protein n=1 Tax=Cellulomonas gelida TaxID=1712 RepID=A0A4Y3KLD1_9CELL|nr:hypothetical protein CWIS_00120 [Cellulomonas sp. A375-1]GEA84787.1 hypothetical protein CGE01nite_20380 [Cellulomonas gelida]GGL15837.1 hypothetical protein GCM10009774_02810 [Cellulomonas gelida]